MPERLHSKLATLLALYDLGGSRRAVDTEDIAMRAAQVAPRLFRWKKYPEQVHIEAVRSALKGNKFQNPPLVSGGTRSGWQLTPEGVRLCQEFRRSSKTEVRSDVQRIRLTKAFIKWQSNGDDALSITDVHEALRINEYFPEVQRRQRVAAFLNSILDDPELQAFASTIQRKYPEVMRT